MCHGESTWMVSYSSGCTGLNEAWGNLAALCLFCNAKTITDRIVRSGFESWLCQLQVSTVKPLDLVKSHNLISFLTRIILASDLFAWL